MFNKSERTQNVLKSTVTGEIYSVVNLLLGFTYRSIFLHFLTVEYLGINGLFTQLLNLLGMADLGITNAIVFRFYRPIQEDDYVQVGKLMNFFKHVYRIIFCVIMGVGLSMLPFIKILIKDSSEIPADVNIYVAFFLYLFQTASSYMFAYRQTLLVADQRKYIVTGAQTVITIIRYTIQIVTLAITHDYILTLVANIITNVGGNYLISLYAVRKYKAVFAVTEKITTAETKDIMKDTTACLSHKVGSVVLRSTDAIILSQFEGLMAVGLYSNYSLIINNLQTLISQMLSNTTASLGNVNVSMDKEGQYRVYKNLNFVNLWIVASITICLYTLVDPFITLWIGRKMLLDEFTVILLCMQFYLELSRQTNMSFTSASGLFVKDVIRPYIEAGLNLVTSIIAVQYWGIAGVFIGTIVSCLLTVTWREPYLLFKYIFMRSMASYWTQFISFALLTIAICTVARTIVAGIIGSFISWILCGVLVFLATQLVFIILFWKSEERKYLFNLVFNLSKKIIKKRG
ncbi:hypothetical protein B5G28_08435 [Faecalibacterium sp. An77]|uniref:lipopolysaccharide biosynthesis protein n=1 Tax=Faecalibacterium sp. An77 TaxID=1965655 RepID=UPI000B3A23FD|nr:hypothetical protein [Faecalibacterium sp. An77]OUN38709.1 hypothetical protein B5G28_08435 [Faecalibacterium sp. An77]